MNPNPPQKNKRIIKIGNVEVQSCVSLAPMAGITDLPLRQLIRRYSKNCLLTTEMISSEMLMQNRKDGNMILEREDNEFPLAYQLSGHKPLMMAAAAKKIEKYADIIDINMGCPVKKVVGGGDGSALMRTPQLASDIVKAIKDTVDVPVTVKFRLGYTAAEQNFMEFAKLMEESGADAMTIHCRTRAQMYAGQADWKAICNVKKEIKVPVFANGDVVDIESAKKCLQESNADGIAIGRGILGNPDLIARIEHYLETGETLPDSDIFERIALLKDHIEHEVKFRSERVAMQFVRKFYPYYLKGFQGASWYRNKLVQENGFVQAMRILITLEERLKEQSAPPTLWEREFADIEK